ncbi:MAG TPA: type II toxin-antitoxin system Phd/YefM family antitoxin [Actinomycetales bacterium]|nr:type II toxin-antitoxin system Phd/YefM family antitoxin [Actinomycetales bacterium]
MKTMSYSESRARYAEVLEAVVSGGEEIIITRSGRESAVILSLETYEALRRAAGGPDLRVVKPATRRTGVRALTRRDPGVESTEDTVSYLRGER